MKTLSKLLVIIFTLALAACNTKPKAEEQAPPPPPPPLTETPITSDYFQLRSMALSIPAQDVDPNLPADKTTVYGVVLDLNMGKGIATLTAFKTGDASIYASAGGGVVGGIEHENVKAASIKFVNTANQYVSKMQRSDSLSLPPNGVAQFCLLTNKGKYVAQESLLKLQDKTSPYMELFMEANKVMSEFRKVAK
jgi:hypothetical protein